MTTPDAAREYLSRGWQPIPVPHRSKKPALKGWPDLRLTAADLARHFNGQPSNLGILLGEPSGGLVDADLDCAEALHLAPAFLQVRSPGRFDDQGPGRRAELIDAEEVRLVS